MPKRVSHLWEKVCTYENCLRASTDVEVNHNGATALRNPLSQQKIERRAQNVLKVLQDFSWKPMKFRVKEIREGNKRKVRRLRIPSQFDQAVHRAILNILEVEILKRNYYYNCGSIPKAGQIRAHRGIKRYLSKGHYKYAFQWDISKFYDNITHKSILDSFKRFIKDPNMLRGISMILESMLSQEELLRPFFERTLLAIGFNPSHWFANVVVNRVLQTAINNSKNMKFIQYMDDGLVLSNNKRKLHRVGDKIQNILCSLELKIKENYQLYRIRSRGIRYLSYIYYHDYILIRKYLMYKVSKRVRKLTVLSSHYSMSLLSLLGLLKHCDSYNLRKSYVYSKLKIKSLKEVVSNESKLRYSLCRAAA